MDSTVFLLGILVILPVAAGLVCLAVNSPIVRKVIVYAVSAAISISSVILAVLLSTSGGRIDLSFENFMINPETVIQLLDFVLVGFIVYLAVINKNYLVLLFSLIQLAFIGYLEFSVHPKAPEYAISIDYLSLVLVFLVSVIGPLILIYGLDYMDEHEHHKKVKKSKQNVFFFVMLLFLGAMNGLVMSDNILWVYFFWEITTLCSFLLIGHDKTEQAIKNANLAFKLNMLGGVAFIAGITVIYQSVGTLSLMQISSSGDAYSTSVFIPFALGLLCFAGFTKSAQFPFQSWLLGAMIAPTPVSALLHSSTMVKAGVYLIVRISPSFAGTTLGIAVAVAGAFTFASASAIAISQNHGKRVLAYSTIANLGLIICCAGIGTKVAIGAAILLIILHAVSKALLFLCMGTIEHNIGSLIIDDMQGLMNKMPFTAVITAFGMVSMLLPPFGVLITKWLAIEAAVNMPYVLILIILGSAFTIVFWAKWIGLMFNMQFTKEVVVEKLKFAAKMSLSVLFTGVFLVSILLLPIYKLFIYPHIASLTFPLGQGGNVGLIGDSFGFALLSPDINDFVGGFQFIWIFFALFALMLLIPVYFRKIKPDSLRAPYMCGELPEDDKTGAKYIGPMDKVDNAEVKNFYLSNIFGEKKLTLWLNVAAIIIIFTMFIKIS